MISIIIPPVMKPVVKMIIPAMFRTIIGVFTAVIDIIPSEYTRGMFSDLLLDSGMLF